MKVLIIEDDMIMLQTCKKLLETEKDFFVSGYTSFEDSERHLVRENPDVILLDVQLPGISGLNAISPIRKHLPKTHIIILTVSESEQIIFQALANGASGYLTKNCSSQKIIDSIREVSEGGGPMTMNIARMVIRSFQKNSESPLSKRETEILQLIMAGKKRNEIAQDLFIEVVTVKAHIRNIYTKLDVNSRSKALDVARKNRFI